MKAPGVSPSWGPPRGVPFPQVIEALVPTFIET
jgi:hypothetical protein